LPFRFSFTLFFDGVLRQNAFFFFYDTVFRVTPFGNSFSSSRCFYKSFPVVSPLRSRSEVRFDDFFFLPRFWRQNGLSPRVSFLVASLLNSFYGFPSPPRSSSFKYGPLFFLPPSRIFPSSPHRDLSLSLFSGFSFRVASLLPPFRDFFLFFPSDSFLSTAKIDATFHSCFCRAGAFLS